MKKRARRRLVGAVVLAVLAIVFVPMVLNKEPPAERRDVALTIPGENAAAPLPPPPAVAPEPLMVPPEAADVPPIDGMPDDRAAVGGGAVSDEEAEAADALASFADDTPAAGRRAPVPLENPSTPTASAADASGGGAYAIQFGVFSKSANVKQLRDQLSGEGVKSYTEALKNGAGTLTRVRGGPFPSRAEAERARDRLKAKGIHSVVVADRG